MTSSWRSTGAKAMRVVIAAGAGPGGAINAAVREAGVTRSSPSGVTYPSLRPPDYAQRLRKQTLLVTLLAAIGAVPIGLLSAMSALSPERTGSRDDVGVYADWAFRLVLWLGALGASVALMTVIGLGLFAVIQRYVLPTRPRERR